MRSVELADKETYSPTLSNLGLRTLGYQLDESEAYSATWARELGKFCERDDRIKTLADRVAVSLFADLYGRDGFRPHDKGEAEEFAEMLLDSGSWECRLHEFLSWYLPVERQELFQTMVADTSARAFEVPVSGEPVVGPYDEPLSEADVETVTTELKKYGGQTTLGSDRPTDATLPELGIMLGRQFNEVISDCGSLNPDYTEDRIFDTMIEAENRVVDAGYEPDLALISGRVENSRAVPARLRTVEDKYLGPSEFIIADTDHLGFRVVGQEWECQTMSGVHMGQHRVNYDPESTLGFRTTTRQGIAVTNEDAVFRGLCRP